MICVLTCMRSLMNSSARHRQCGSLIRQRQQRCFHCISDQVSKKLSYLESSIDRNAQRSFPPRLDWIMEKPWTSYRLVAWKYDHRPNHVRIVHMTMAERHFYEQSIRRTRAADLRDSLERITTLYDDCNKNNNTNNNTTIDDDLIDNLPIFRPPENLPIELHFPERYQNNKKVVRMRWPESPGPVSVGLAETFQNADSLQFVDVLCGISFVHALCGMTYGTTQKYYIQKLDDTLLVQRIPEPNSLAHLQPRRLAAEQFCNPNYQEDNQDHHHVDEDHDDEDHRDDDHDEHHHPRIKYFTVGKFRIAQWLLKVVAEVHSFETDTRCPVFIRTAACPSTFNLESLVHAVFSNSTQIVNFQYDEEQLLLTQMGIHPVHDLCTVHRKWPLLGQRFKYMLNRILKHAIVHESTQEPLILRFTRKKFPFFEKAPKDSSIIPPYTQELLLSQSSTTATTLATDKTLERM